jgi:dienelactone hydrolase
MKYLIQYAYALFFLLALSCSSGQKSQNEETENVEKEIIEESTGVDEVEIEGKELSYSTASTDMKGYMAYPKNMDGEAPGILVVHEWWGHNDYARQRADMLARMGYVAMAIDMYGEGKTAGHPEDAGKFTQEVMSNIEEAKARFASAMQTLQNSEMVDSSRIGAIGYCFGGSVALSMANAGMDLKGVVAFHSGVQLPIQPENGSVKGKILVCNGADDPFISPESVVNFESAMDAAGADYEYLVYEGAKHSFTSPVADSLGKQFELPLEYNKAADEDSWNRMTALFTEVF